MGKFGRTIAAIFGILLIVALIVISPFLLWMMAGDESGNGIIWLPILIICFLLGLSIFMFVLARKKK